MFSLKGYDFAANIHLFEWSDLNILLDVNSGAIHVIDEISYDVLNLIISNQGDLDAVEKSWAEKPVVKSEMQQVMTEIKLLYEQGALFTNDETPRIDLAEMSIKAVCLNVAHLCNMRCHYCFASQGDFGMKPCLMTIETAKKAMDFLIEQSGSIRNLEVDFFGGEPLLVVDTLKELVEYCRLKEKEHRKRFNFTLTTNATLLNEEIIEWVIDNDISMILSLDGRKETNDRHRVFNDGCGTYEVILPWIKKMVANNPVSYYVRGTFTRKNPDFAKDLQHLIDLGFNCLSLEPAVGPDNGFSILKEDLPQVLREYEKLTAVLVDEYQAGKDIHFFHYDLNLQKGPCLAKRSTGCGAGIEYIVITPEGDIYPCHQFVGEDEFYMGNIYAGITDKSVRKRFEDNQLKDKECQKCWARFFCGGGCHAGAYFANNDMSKPNDISCQMHRKRIEGAIFLEIQKQILANKMTQ